jgi:hypothetical protein
MNLTAPLNFSTCLAAIECVSDAATVCRPALRAKRIASGMVLADVFAASYSRRKYEEARVNPPENPLEPDE